MTDASLFTLRRLGDLAEVFDGPHATPRKVDSGPWFLNIASLKNGRLDLSESTHIHSDDVARWSRRVTPQRGDALFSYETRIGQSALWDSDDEAVLGRRMGLLRPRPGLVHPRFLVYAYLAQQFQDVIRLETLHGATVDRIPIGKMPDWPIAIPPLEEQERIAGVLGAFDDLIETNRRLADNLDDLRRTKVSHTLSASSATTRLSEVASFVNGRNFTKGADGIGRPVIRTPEVRSGPGGNTVWSSAAADDDRVARAGDILFVWSGTLMVNRWLYTEGLVNQHVFKVIPKNVPDWYVFALIEAQLLWFLGLAKDKATTMGHIQRAHLDEPMTGLDPDAIARLGPVIEPIWSAALDLRLEAQDLARQRDELLPLLMSGGVRVRDLEAVA